MLPKLGSRSPASALSNCMTGMHHHVCLPFLSFYWCLNCGLMLARQVLYCFSHDLALFR
jgi:hypothetical protein